MRIDVRDREMMLAAACHCPWLLLSLWKYYARIIRMMERQFVFSDVLLLNSCPFIVGVPAMVHADYIYCLLHGVEPPRRPHGVPDYLRPALKDSHVFASDNRSPVGFVYCKVKSPSFDAPLLFVDRKREVVRIDDLAPFQSGLDALGLLYELQGRPIPRTGMVHPSCLLEILGGDGLLRWNQSLLEALVESAYMDESWVFRLWRKRPREKRSKALPAFVLKEVDRRIHGGMSPGEAIQSVAHGLPLAPATVKTVYFTARRKLGIRRRLGSRHYKSGSRPESPH